jgi:hypothetical protein
LCGAVQCVHCWTSEWLEPFVSSPPLLFLLLSLLLFLLLLLLLLHFLPFVFLFLFLLPPFTSVTQNFEASSSHFWQNYLQGTRPIAIYIYSHFYIPLYVSGIYW